MADPIGALIQLWNRERQEKLDAENIRRNNQTNFMQGLTALQNANRINNANPRMPAQFKQELANALGIDDPQKQSQAIMQVGAKYGGFYGLEKQIGNYVNGLGKVRGAGSTVAEKKFDMDKQAKDTKRRKEDDMLFDSAEQTLSTIGEIKKGMKYFGAAGDLPPWPAEYGKKNWLANVNRLKDKLVVDLMLKLKSASPTGSTGFGQLSEKEGQRLENAATALQKGLKEEDALRYLGEIEAGANKILSSKEIDGTEMPHPLGKGNPLQSLKSKYGLK